MVEVNTMKARNLVLITTLIMSHVALAESAGTTPTRETAPSHDLIPPAANQDDRNCSPWCAGRLAA